jgi:hypothetical protein
LGYLDWVEGDTNDIFLNDIFHDYDPNRPVVATASTIGSRRREMTERLRHMGIARPTYSRNSKA